MVESLRDIAIDSFKRGQDEITAQLQMILARVLERVVEPGDIKFTKHGLTWHTEIDDIRFRMIHRPESGWRTEVWSPESEWSHFGSLATLGDILSHEEGLL